MSGERGWFWPTGARKAHFDGGDSRALCGKWMRQHPFGGAATAAPIIAGADSPRSPDGRRLDGEAQA